MITPIINMRYEYANFYVLQLWKLLSSSKDVRKLYV